MNREGQLLGIVASCYTCFASGSVDGAQKMNAHPTKFAIEEPVMSVENGYISSKPGVVP